MNSDKPSVLLHVDYVAHREDGVFILLTPVLAYLFLLTMVGNRTVNRRRVNALIHAIENGYEDTGRAITFDLLGRMFAGQHRCLACILSGISFITRVAWGISEEGVKRERAGKEEWSAADVISVVDFLDNKTIDQTDPLILQVLTGGDLTHEVVEKIEKQLNATKNRVPRPRQTPYAKQIAAWANTARTLLKGNHATFDHEGYELFMVEHADAIKWALPYAKNYPFRLAYVGGTLLFAWPRFKSEIDTLARQLSLPQSALNATDPAWHIHEYIKKYGTTNNPITAMKFILRACLASGEKKGMFKFSSVTDLQLQEFQGLYPETDCLHRSAIK